MKNWTLAIGTPIAVALLFAGCIETFEDDCKVSSTCPPEGDGDGDGDTGGTGGDGDGDGDGDTGGGANSACDPECEGDTPVCNADQQCVQCTEEDSSACTGETSLCDAASETCVQCLDSDDCSETAPLCDGDSCSGCESNLDCERFTDAPVCDQDSGACVGCLSADDCEGNVCDPETNTCTSIPAGTEFACEPCQYDAQCADGHVCVEMSYDDPVVGVVGTFCLWLKDADEVGAPDGTCGLNSRPYAEQASVTTVDGDPAVVCQPRTSTCPAVLQHAASIDGCEIPGDDDAACGAEAYNDGRCRENSSLEPECTYPCSDNRDCPTGFTCPMAGDKFCSL